ncbi:MAG TPA: hypothetical protein VNA12_00655 [Mycobacteriales bacterium]|nr:hypothetical protein [Mycobacteriales bacterium]
METLVLVLTDVQGSTRLWQDESAAMDAAMARHHEIVHGAVAEHGGFRPVDQGEGDAVFAAFRSATEAIAAVAQVQRELAAEPWPTSIPLKERIGVHLGEVTERGGNLYGDPVNRCARLRGLGAGGQTLLSAPVYEVVRDKLPPGASVIDLGEHRMKDLTRPEHVWQLDLNDLPDEFPPLASLDVATHNLPEQAAPFIGREAELAGLVDAVRAHRLVTLTGFGGMGKTRLALQAAAELVGDPDVGAVWFVDLSAVTDPALVPARVAEAVGVRYGADDPANALVAALTAAPALLVLDNLEQVMGCATFVADLISRAPRSRVLATSREPLRVRSERQVELTPMSLPDPSEPPPTAEQLSTFEAVRFFVDRACAVRADFAVTNDTAPAVAAICTRLDGHPLALELAAARTKVLSVDKLLARLDSALGILTGGSRDMPERHQTLRATIAWSFDALSADEQRLLARMSVLPAPTDYEMVEAVGGADLDVLDLLEVLVDRSLVRTSEVSSDTRYGLLVSIRDYAAEHLDDQEKADCHDRHAQQVLDIFTRPRPWSTSVHLVARQLPHLRAAWDHLRSTGADADAVALAVGVEDGLYHCGLILDSLSWKLAAEKLTSDPAQRAPLSGVAVQSLKALGRADQAREVAHAGLEQARICGDPGMHANVLVVVAALSDSRAALTAYVEEYAQVRPRLDPAAALAFDAERAISMASALRLVEPVEAERVSRAALTAGLQMRPIHQVRLARTLIDQGRGTEAWTVLEQVQDPAVFDGMTAWEVIGQVASAAALLLLGEPQQAGELAERAWERVVALSLQPTDATFVLAGVARRESDFVQSLAFLDRGLARLPVDAVADAAMLRWRRAIVLHRLGRTDEATDEIADARAILETREMLLLELLGCLGAEAVITTDDAVAAGLLDRIAAQRGPWVLPFDLDDDLREVERRLGRRP